MSTSLVNRQRERLRLSPVSLSVHPSLSCLQTFVHKKNALFHFSASVVGVHSFVHTEVRMPSHLQNVLFSCFHDSLSNEETWGVMFPWLLSPVRNSECSEVKINKSAWWRHDGCAGCSWLRHAPLLANGKWKWSTAAGGKQCVDALETLNTAITTIQKGAQINHPELGPSDQM